jgi:hypothetical protein
MLFYFGMALLCWIAFFGCIYVLDKITTGPWTFWRFAVFIHAVILSSIFAFACAELVVQGCCVVFRR